MKNEKSTNTAIRISPSEKEYLEKRSKEMGVTFTDLLKTGAMMCASFDPVFWKKIETFSQNLGVKEYLVLQNIAISWMARREAEADVLGGEAESILLEFQFTENGPVTGEQLFNILKSDEIRKLENEKEHRLQRESQYGPIPEEDAEWLKKRMEKYKHAVEAQKRAKENREKGLAFSFTEADVKKSGLTESEYEAKVLVDMKAKREKTGIK